MSNSLWFKEVLTHSRTNRILLLTIYLVCLLFSIGAGFVAATGNPLFAALLIALVGGGVLLAYPSALVWVVIVGSIAIAGLLPLFFPGFGRIRWVVSIAGFLLLGYSLIYVLWQNKSTSSTPSFVWFSLAFITYTIITSIIQFVPLAEVVAGLKRYFQSWGLLFALALVSFSYLQYNKWLKFLLAAALLQLPFVFYQYFVLVPKREAMLIVNSGMVPIDVVAGTFGSSLEGGGANGVLVAFLVICLGFVIALKKENLLSTSKTLLLSILILIPIFMGEAKISLIFLLVLGLVILKRDVLARPFLAMLSFILILSLMSLVTWVYVSLYSKGLSPEVWLEHIIAYNFGDVGLEGWVLNRTTVLIFWWEEHGLYNLAQTLIGHGLGSSFMGAGALVSGHVHEAYPYMGIGLTSASTILWDTGVFGCVIFTMIFILAWRKATSLVKKSDVKLVRAYALGLQVSIAIVVVSIFYKDMMTSHLGGGALFAFTLGFLGYLCSKHLDETGEIV